ncbi:hypothetical protein BGZ81_002143, partial [Podila clonocystis]
RESSPSRKSLRHHSDGERGNKRESSSRSSRHSKDKDHRDDRESRKSSRTEDDRDKEKAKEKDRDRSRHSSSTSRRRRDRSESRSVSESSSGGSDGSGSESEEDELVKKAKSMIQKISEDDYYAKSTEFRLWLRRSKKKYFEEMTADETRRYFKKFVKAWNNFDLDESYYKGIRSSQISNKGSTKYKWGFAKKIGKEDQSQVDSVRDSIDTMTNIRFANEVSRQTGVSTASSLGGGSASSSSMGPPKRQAGPSMPSQGPGPRRPRTADDVADQEDRDQRRRLQDRAAQKSLRKSKEADLEELVPKATGREAMLEKRRAQTAYHRRERSPDVELPEHALMGTGGGDDYKSMLAAERRRKEAREERKYGSGSFGPSAGPSGASAPTASGGGVSSVLEAKQAAYKEKEAKQLDAFRQLWAQSQAAKGL